MFEFDVNNGLTIPSYSDWPSSASYVEFRRALAYMVDKPYIVSKILGGYGVVLETPIMPWLQWYNPNIEPYSYNPNLACQILFDAG